MKKTIFLLLFLCALGAALPARALVLPFRVAESGQSAHRWLGQALSFYLTAGLRLNGAAVFGDEEMRAGLEGRGIRFPFDIAKATAILLARQEGADTLVLGQVLYRASAAMPITVKMSLVDVVGGRQTHLPLLRARTEDLFRLQAELLRQLLKAFNRPALNARQPELNLSPAEYERFIKSLLVGDGGKKAELLQPLADAGTRSDFALFELGRLRLQEGQFASARALLERIGDSLLHVDGKRFLLALADWHENRADDALNRLLELQRAGVFPVETGNNLGVVYMGRGEDEAALSCLRRALTLRQAPEIFQNLVLLLQRTGLSTLARRELVRGLTQFPEDEGLRTLFVRALAGSEPRALLDGAFRSYVLAPPLKGDEPALAPRLLSPYAATAATPADGEARALCAEARSLFLENDLEGALDKVQQALEINPFLADGHHLLALIHLQRRQLDAAEMYGRGALFLNENAGNYLLLIKVLQSGGQAAAAQEAMAEALRKFPADRELRDIGPGDG